MIHPSLQNLPSTHYVFSLLHVCSMWKENLILLSDANISDIEIILTVIETALRKPEQSPNLERENMAARHCRAHLNPCRSFGMSG